MKEQEKCKTCRYFVKERPTSDEGDCRYDTPKIFPVPSQMGLQIVTAWPKVSENRICGKYTPEVL